MGKKYEDIYKIKNMDFGVYNEDILNFIKILRKNNINTKLLKINLKWLKIIDNGEKIKIYDFFEKKESVGYYDIKFNSIYLSKDCDFSTLEHELLHVSSSKFFPDSGTFVSGITFKNKKSIIANELNEGYTELLIKRYFDENIEKVTGYGYQMKLASIFEDLVGKEKMKESYFKAKPNIILNKLKKYLTEKEVILLLKSTSSELKLKKTRKLLLKAYIRKMYEDLDTNKITTDEYINKMGEFLYSLGIRTLNSNKYDIINLNDIIDEWLKKELENLKKFVIEFKEEFPDQDCIKLIDSYEKKRIYQIGRLAKKYKK